MKPRPHIVALIACTIAAGCGNCGGPPDSPGQFHVGSQPRLEQPRVETELRQAHREAGRDFAFDLLRAVDETTEDANLVVPAYSTHRALAKLHIGAASETADEMEKVLGGFGDDIHEPFNELEIRLASHADEAGFRLDEVSAIAIDDAVSPPHATLNILRRHYSDGIHGLDLQHAEPSRQALNRWVARRTGHNIVDLVDDTAHIDEASILLVSALRFSAPWLHDFEAGTAPASFRRLDGSTADVMMMRAEEGFRFYDGPRSVAVAVPYAGAGVFFIAIMPADAESFDQWASTLDRQHFDEIVDGLSGFQLGTVHLPRFEITTKVDLEAPLRRLGVTTAFDPASADFSALSGDEDKSLLLSIARLGAAVELDERGTGDAYSSHRPGEIPQPAEDAEYSLRLDRPFYFAVYDEGAQTILLLGRLLDGGRL